MADARGFGLGMALGSRLGPLWSTELRAIGGLAWPVVIQTTAQQGMTVTDQVFLGHLGTSELGAAALGNAYTNLMWFFLLGFATALDTLGSHAYGAGNHRALITTCVTAAVLTTLLVAPLAAGMGLGQLAGRALFGQDEHTSALMGRFCSGLIPGMWPLMWGIVLTKYLQVQNVMLAPSLVAVATFFLNIGANAALVSALGFRGAPLATTLSRWAQFAMMLAVVWHHERTRGRRRFSQGGACGGSDGGEAGEPTAVAAGCSGGNAAGDGCMVLLMGEGGSTAPAGGPQAARRGAAGDAPWEGDTAPLLLPSLDGHSSSAAVHTGCGLGAPAAPAGYTAPGPSMGGSEWGAGAPVPQAGSATSALAWPGADTPSMHQQQQQQQLGEEQHPDGLWREVRSASFGGDASGDARQAQRFSGLQGGADGGGGNGGEASFWSEAVRECREAVKPAALMRFLRLGIPGGLSLAFEAGCFDFSTALAGRLGAVNTAAHAATLSVVTLTYLACPFALATAGAIRVGNLLGAGEPDAARRAGILAVALSGGFMALMALTLLACRGVLGYLFSSDPRVVRVVRHLALFAALFQVSDGLMGASQGVLRGCGHQHLTAVFNLTGFWLCGVLLGWLLCFKAGWGISGLWTGISSGDTVTCVLNLLAMSRIRWKREADKAVARLEAQAQQAEEEQAILAGPSTGGRGCVDNDGDGGCLGGGGGGANSSSPPVGGGGRSFAGGLKRMWSERRVGQEVAEARRRRAAAESCSGDGGGTTAAGRLLRSLSSMFRRSEGGERGSAQEAGGRVAAGREGKGRGELELLP